MPATDTAPIVTGPSEQPVPMAPPTSELPQDVAPTAVRTTRPVFEHIQIVDALDGERRAAYRTSQPLIQQLKASHLTFFTLDPSDN